MTTADELTRDLDAVKAALKSKKLSQAELDELALDVARLRDRIEQRQQKRFTVLDWWGVGKELWSTIDVDEYIRKERASWR